MTTTHENKGQSTSDIVLVILKNYNDARNNECKKNIVTDYRRVTHTHKQLLSQMALVPYYYYFYTTITTTAAATTTTTTAAAAVSVLGILLRFLTESKHFLFR